jgi:hypothetical protein
VCVRVCLFVSSGMSAMASAHEAVSYKQAQLCVMCGCVCVCVCLSRPVCQPWQARMRLGVTNRRNCVCCAAVCACVYVCLVQYVSHASAHEAVSYKQAQRCVCCAAVRVCLRVACSCTSSGMSALLLVSAKAVSSPHTRAAVRN